MNRNVPEGLFFNHEVDTTTHYFVFITKLCKVLSRFFYPFLPQLSNVFLTVVLGCLSHLVCTSLLILRDLSEGLNPITSPPVIDR